MGGKSELEERFSLQLAGHRISPPVREHRFHPSRKWRFDFAWPDQMVAVEIQGGVWTRGKHGRGAGLVSSFEKNNAAAILGWWVLQGDASMIRNGTLLDDVTAALGQPTDRHPADPNM
tara:strand:- start:326 stop:679 length:354 start_codon:yes stop_codon:yes gene_type:complete